MRKLALLVVLGVFAASGQEFKMNCKPSFRAELELSADANESSTFSAIPKMQPSQRTPFKTASKTTRALLARRFGAV